MKTALAAILSIFCVAALGCDPADIASFKIELRASRAFTSDVGWRNHLNFLRVMNVLPDTVTLEVPRLALAGGAFGDETTFLAAVDQRLRDPASNLFLRAIGHWMHGLTAGIERPELAGLFFGWVVNQYVTTPGTNADGQPTVTARSAEHVVKSQFFQVFPSLQELESLEAKGPAAILARLNKAHFAMLALFRANTDHFNTILKVALDLPSASLSLNLGMPVPLTAEVGPAGTSGRAFLWIPLPEGATDSLPLDIPWKLRMRVGEQPVAIVLGLSADFQRKVMSDALWFERLLMPLLAEVAEQPHLRGPVPVFRERIGVDSSEARDQAIRTLLTTTLALYPGARREAIFVAVQRTVEANFDVNFGTIELVARRFDLPVHLFSSDERLANRVRVWPRVNSRRTPTVPPSRVLSIYVGTDTDVIARKYEEFNLTPVTNIEMLSTVTGIARETK